MPVESNFIITKGNVKKETSKQYFKRVFNSKKRGR